MNFSAIFSFLEPLDPYSKVATTVYGMLANYRQNKKIESVEEDISKIKAVLGLDEINLSDNELKVSALFIKKSEQSNDATGSISIAYVEFVKLDLNEDIDDVLMYMESYGFLDVNTCMSGESFYKLNYTIFMNSNLLHNIFNQSMTYSELFRLVVDHIYNNYRRENAVQTNQLIEELSLNGFLLNPILYHLDQLGVIDLIHTNGYVDLIARDSMIRKPKLFEVYKELNR